MSEGLVSNKRRFDQLEEASPESIVMLPDDVIALILCQAALLEGKRVQSLLLVSKKLYAKLVGSIDFWRGLYVDMPVSSEHNDFFDPKLQVTTGRLIAKTSGNVDSSSLSLQQLRDLVEAQGFARRLLRLWDKEACPPEEVTFLTLGYCDTECFAFLRSDSLAATFAAACVGKQAKGNNKMVDGQSFNSLAQAILDRGEDEDVDDGENEGPSTVRTDSVEKMKQLLSAFRPQIMYAEGQGANCDALVDALYFYHRSAVAGMFLFKQW